MPPPRAGLPNDTYPAKNPNPGSRSGLADFSDRMLRMLRNRSGPTPAPPIRNEAQTRGVGLYAT